MKYVRPSNPFKPPQTPSDPLGRFNPIIPYQTLSCPQTRLETQTLSDP